MQANVMTYVDIFQPEKRQHALLYNALMVMGGSVFIALASRITIPIPFSPVPITGQTLAVLLTGTLLGSKRGALSVFAYLTAGASGLPVFAGGGAGIVYLLGPTGGYLVGFVIAAYVTGLLAEKGWDRRIFTTALAMAVGNVIIYLCGLCWLASFVGINRVFALGLYPFIPGDLVKLIIATILLPTGWKMVRF